MPANRSSKATAIAAAAVSLASLSLMSSPSALVTAFSFKGLSSSSGIIGRHLNAKLSSKSIDVATSCQLRYLVQPGDTCTSIAASQGVSVSTLQSNNDNKLDCVNLTSGDLICVQKTMTSSNPDTPAPGNSTSSNSTSAPVVVNINVCVKTYTSVDGDTCTTLSSSFQSNLPNSTDYISQRSQFVLVNPQLNCLAPIPKGTNICVDYNFDPADPNLKRTIVKPTYAEGCVMTVTLNSTMGCPEVLALCKQMLTEMGDDPNQVSLKTLYSMNQNLNCDALPGADYVGSKVCIDRPGSVNHVHTSGSSAASPSTSTSSSDSTSAAATTSAQSTEQPTTSAAPPPPTTSTSQEPTPTPTPTPTPPPTTDPKNDVDPNTVYGAQGLSSCQFDIMIEITSVFETGSTSPGYATCGDIGDGNGISAGFIQFTTRSGSALAVVKDFASLHPDAWLSSTVSNLANSVGNSGWPTGDFCDRWKSAATDSSTASDFAGSQKRVMASNYVQPNKDLVDKLGLKTATGVAQIYDCAVQIGIGACYTVADNAGGWPSQGNDEADFLRRFLTARSSYYDYLGGAYPGTAYRLRSYRHIIDTGNLNFNGGQVEMLDNSGFPITAKC
ncbi:lysozyme-like domain-containing protein [Zopfochytrium polystomum]|nr:lysozyme-like domain-containing protein [Zopfochytrium polystomum]